MKSTAVLAIVAICAIGGAAAGVGARDLTPTTTPVSNDTVASPRTPATLEELTVATGKVGDASVGMSKSDALDTGMFDADVAPAAEGCQVAELAWKPPYSEALDVQTLGNGQIVSIGINRPGTTTDSGLGVGSTLAQVRAVVEDKNAETAGYGQSGLYTFDPEEGGWIGFLFAEKVSDLKASSPVTFMEVTRGARPDLMRDGC